MQKNSPGVELPTVKFAGGTYSTKPPSHPQPLPDYNNGELVQLVSLAGCQTLVWMPLGTTCFKLNSSTSERERKPKRKQKDQKIEESDATLHDTNVNDDDFPNPGTFCAFPVFR